MSQSDAVPLELLSDAGLSEVRFDRLIGSFIRNDLNRTVFQHWEIAVLIDIAACQMSHRVTPRTLGDYRKAARKQLAETGGAPMLLSEYLDRRQRNRRRPKNEDPDGQPGEIAHGLK